MRCVAALVMMLVLSVESAAESGDGLKAGVSIGQSSLTITNPSGTNAYYSGLGGLAKGYIPVLVVGRFRTDLTGLIEFLDFENTANGSQSEYAQYLGPGAGLEFSVSNLFAGVDYRYFRARHTAVGTLSHKTQFDIQALNYFAGLRFNIGAGTIGAEMSQMSTTIPASAVGLSADSPWKTRTIWIKLTYDFKITTRKFFDSLVGR